MNWNLVSQIASTVGAFITAVSVFSGYQLYSKSKKDEYVNRINNLLIEFTNSCHEMNRFLDNELIHDMAYSIIYREDFTDMLAVLIKKISNKPEIISNDEELKVYIKEELPSITYPIKSDICEKYDQLGEGIILKSSFIKSDFPALYRLIQSINGVYGAISKNNRYLLQNDEIWEEVIVLAFKDKGPDFNIDNIKVSLLKYIVGVLFLKYKEAKDQEDINCMIQIVNIVIPKYLAYINRNIFKMSKKENSVEIKENCETYVDDFLEIEKAFKKYLLSQDEMLEYRTLITEFKARNTKEA